MLEDEVKAMLDCRLRAIRQGSKSNVLLPMPKYEDEDETVSSKDPVCLFVEDH
jgi:hypothetical protein